MPQKPILIIKAPILNPIIPSIVILIGPFEQPFKGTLL